MLPLTRSRNRARFFGIPFSPSSLFAAGEQGAWYDPSDYSTLFDDAAGVTPVSAPGNGADVWVGLMLDKSKGLVLGPELVTNGSGSSTTGWDVGTGLSSLTSVNGEFVATANGGISSQFSRLVTLEVGKWYQCSVTVRSPSSNSVTNLGRLKVEGGLTANLAVQVSQEDTNVTLSGYVLATSTSTRIYVSVQTAAVWGGSGDVLYASNVSIKAIAGNHAFQTSSAKRPKLAARYNLLTYSEDLTNAAWAKYTIASTTTSKFIPSTTNLEHYVANSAAKSAGAVNYVWQCEIKDEGYGFAPIVVADFNGISAANGWYFCVDLSNGTFTTPQTFGSGWAVGAVTINRDSNGWNTVRIAFTTSSVSTRVGVGIYAHPTSKALSPFSFSGDGVSGVGVRNADLRPASQATGAIGPTYQRVAAATVYDTAGFLPYLFFDGNTWSMSTNSIDFSGTQWINVFAGVRKLQDATRGIVVDHLDNVLLNNGFNLNTPFDSTDKIRFASFGSSAAPANATTGVDAPITVVASGIGSITQDVSILRLNGAQVASNTTDQGGGGYGNNILSIGARNNASLFFNGWMYSLTVRGAQSSASQISSMESWVAGKTGVSL